MDDDDGVSTEFGTLVPEVARREFLDATNVFAKDHGLAREEVQDNFCIEVRRGRHPSDRSGRVAAWRRTQAYFGFPSRHPFSEVQAEIALEVDEGWQRASRPRRLCPGDDGRLPVQGGFG